MSRVDVDHLRSVDPESIKLAPKAEVEPRRAQSVAITLGALREFAIPRYRQQLASIGSPAVEADADDDKGRESKDRAKVNQYSSAAFASIAKRAGGWDVPAQLIIESALVEANKLPNNRKPRAELNRALGHLKQLESKESGVVERQRSSGRNRATHSHAPRTKKELGPFGQLLSASIERKGVSIAALAAKFNITYLKLWKWAYDNIQPSAEADKVVKEMSVYLGLGVNELWALRTIPKRVSWPAGFPACRKARARVLRKCPGLAELPPQEQDAEIWNAHNLIPNKPERKKKHRLSRDVNIWPSQLAAELSAMLAVKRNRSEPVLKY